jgi:FkbM family methyltransferase
MKYYSQHGQDRFLVEKIFKKKRDGFFVDIGANDGVTLSNTYVFEKELGWKGICVEPIPDVFEKLKKSRNSINVNKCIGNKDNGVVKFMKIEGYAEMLSGIVDYFDDHHKKRIEEYQKEHGGTSTIIDIGCIRLNTLLKEHGVKKVDYCSIDVEGGEMGVLESIDFSDIDIEVMSVENNNSNRDQTNYIMGKGYRLIKRLGVDEIFMKGEQKKSFFSFFKK